MAQIFQANVFQNNVFQVGSVTATLAVTEADDTVVSTATLGAIPSTGAGGPSAGAGHKPRRPSIYWTCAEGEFRVKTDCELPKQLTRRDIKAEIELAAEYILAGSPRVGTAEFKAEIAQDPVVAAMLACEYKRVQKEIGRQVQILLEGEAARRRAAEELDEEEAIFMLMLAA